MKQSDVIVIGAGIAGLSAAYFLSQDANVTVLERENNTGYHSSGRTAAQFTVGITAIRMRRLAQASRTFFENPPRGFVDHPLLTRRGALTMATAEQKSELVELHTLLKGAGATARFVDTKEALELFPMLKAERFEGGVFEPDAMDIDVDLLLNAYQRGARKKGVEIRTGIEISTIKRKSDLWHIQSNQGEFTASLILNAAGAWVDEVTRMAGLAPLGIQPHRRTAFTFAAPDETRGEIWPDVSSIDDNWYVCPKPGYFMGSLADATPTDACDAYPEDIDVAQAIYNIEQDTTLKVGRPIAVWAGLRSYVKDQNPVIGTRADAEGFYWYAGQGGCGILTSPAAAQAISDLMLEQKLAPHLQQAGISSQDLSPERDTL